MNSLKQYVETALKPFKGEIIAINVLEEGVFPVKDNYQYLKSIRINDVIVGSSSKNRLEDNLRILGVKK